MPHFKFETAVLRQNYKETVGSNVKRAKSRYMISKDIQLLWPYIIASRTIRNLLGSNISLCAQYSSRNMSSSFIRSKLGQSKIRNLGMKVLVQQNVTALKISVNHWGTDLFMEIFQTLCSFKSYSQSRFPV